MKRGPDTAPPALKELEQALLPLVKRGDELQRSAAASSADLGAAMSLYQQAMDGFQSAGYGRPKLHAKIGALQQRLQRAGPCAPAAAAACSEAVASAEATAQ